MPGIVSLENWNGEVIAGAYSRGGVLSVAKVQNNLIQGTKWPPAAIVQKLYRSKHSSAFGFDELALLESELGYYCDLQSLHSEDAITWSFFGTLDEADPPVRIDFLNWLNHRLEAEEIDSTCDLTLWRRVPHPDTLVPGGPEIDVLLVGDQTVTALEVKWRSREGLGQGKDRDKGQMQLRREFFERLGARIYPGKNCRVLGVAWEPEKGWLTWDELRGWDGHPGGTEFRSYLDWKIANSQPVPRRHPLVPNLVEDSAVDRRSAGNDDAELVAKAAEALPGAANAYIETDFLLNLFETVLDYQMNTKAVVKALEHFNKGLRDEVNSLNDLKRLINKFPDDLEGNTRLAQQLWGYNLWTRAHQLRDLVAFFEVQGVTNQEQLVEWATQSDFEKDFKGRVKGLGIAVYHWLIMRQGVESVKPDVHVRRFAESAVGRPLSDSEVIEIVSRAARRLGLKAYELDWRIWEHSRGGGLPYPTSGSTV